MAMKSLIVATVVAGQGLAASWNLKGISAPHVEAGNLVVLQKEFRQRNRTNYQSGRSTIQLSIRGFPG